MDKFPLTEVEQIDLLDRIAAARRKEPLTEYPLSSRYPKYDKSLKGRAKALAAHISAGFDQAGQQFMEAPIHPLGLKGKHAEIAARGLNSAIADIVGTPVDLSTLVYNVPAMALGLPTIDQPVGGSDSIRGLWPEVTESPEERATRVRGLSDLITETPHEVPWLDQALFNTTRMAGMFAGGTKAATMPFIKNIPGALPRMLGDMGPKHALKAGVASGLGLTGGEMVAEHYPDSALAQFAPLVGALGAPVATEMAHIPRLLRGQTGAVSMLPSALSDAWQKSVGSRLMGIGEKVGSLPLLPKQSRFARYMGGNTLNEWLLSPQERMRKSAAQLFRDTRSESERLTEALRTAAMKIGDLNLEERESLRDVMKYNFDISRAKPGTQQKISDALAPLGDAWTTTGAKIFPTAARQNMVEDSLTKQLLHLFQEDTQNPIWSLQKAAGASKYDLTTSKGTNEFLDLILRDPSQKPEIKNLARDLYDIRAIMASEVADAHRRSLELLLASNIKNDARLVITPDQLSQRLQAAHAGGLPDKAALKKMNKEADQFIEVVSDIRQSGPGRMYIPGVGKEFEGLLVDKHVAEGLRDLDTHVSAFRRGWNKYFLHPWKFAKIGLNAPARMRDLYSNFMFNDIYGKAPLSPYRVDVYGSAMKDLVQASKGKMVPELEKYFYHTGGKMEALNSVATDPIFSAMRHGANPLDHVLGYMYKSKVGHFTSELMRNIDLWSKYAKFKHNLASGKFRDDAEAIVDALRSTGNMLEQPRAVRNVRDTAMPFFGWTTHALKTIAHGMANHPVRTLKWYLGPALAGQYAVSKLGMSEQEYADFKNTLPDYMSDEVFGMPKFVPLPARDEKGRIQMVDIAWWIPGLQDLSELSQDMSNPVHLFQNPAFSIAAGLWANKKFYGAPIWNEWDNPDTKWAKGLGHVIQQLVPPLFPGFGNQANKIWEAFKEEDPNALTMPQALGTQIGARITPIDEGVQYQRNQARLQAYINEAKHQMKKELGKNIDPAQQEEVQREYTEIIQRLMEEQAGQR